MLRDTHWLQVGMVLGFVTGWLVVGPSRGWAQHEANERRTALSEASQRTQWAYRRVRRSYRAPPLLPASIVEALATQRAAFAGSWERGAPLEDRNDGREVGHHGIRVGIEALEPDLDAFDDDREGRTQAFDVRSCEALSARIAAVSEPETSGTSPWQVEITPLSLRHDGDVLVQHECRDRFQCPEQVDEERFHLDSLVGPVLSHRRVVGGIGCKTPHETSPHFQTLDLRDGEPAVITDFVDEYSLIEALKQDSWIRDHTSDDERKALETFDDLDAGHPYLGQIDPSRFSFYDWEGDEGRVAIRLWLPAPTGHWTGEFRYLGLWVDPTPEMKRHLEAADEGEGFYMSDEGPVF